MLSVRALRGCDLEGRDASSSLDEPPKVKTGFFFLRGGWAFRTMESAGSLDDSSVDDEGRAKTPDFFMAAALGFSAAAMSAVGMDEGALRRGLVLYDELTCAGEKPLTTLVVLLSEVPLTEPEDTACAEVEATEFSTTGVLGVGAGAAASCGAD